jgi:hypothetical protein
VFDREADLKIVDEQIGVVAQELMNFSREELKFDAPQNTLSQFKSYIRAEDSRLNVVGTFNDASGNSRAEGSGTLTIIDNEERMNSLINSKIVNRFISNFFIQLCLKQHEILRYDQ